MPRASVRIRAAAALLLLPSAALAQGTPLPGPGWPGRDDWALLLLAAMAGFVLASGALLVLLSRRIAEAARLAAAGDGARTAFARLTELPLGVPDGTVRAVLSVFIIVFGFVVIALQDRLGLRSGEAVAGFVGAVISFYFAARGAEQARQAARDTAPMPQAPPMPAAPPDTAAAGGTIATVHAVLDAARVAAEGAALLAPDLALAGNVAAVADQAGRTLDAASQALRGGDAAAIAGAAKTATDLLASLTGKDNPATSVIADALGSLQLGGAGSALLGLGGPVGLVAAIGVGAFQAISRGTEHYERWKARLLDRPYTTNLFPPGPVDAAVALSALERAPIFARAFLTPDIPDRFARAREIAAAAQQDNPTALFDPARFASEDEFRAGLQEFRGRLLDDLLQAVDPAPIEVAEVPGLAGPPVDQQRLRDALAVLRQDPQARDLDALVLSLTGLAASPQVKQAEAMRLLGEQLKAAGALAARAETGTPAAPQEPVA